MILSNPLNISNNSGITSICSANRFVLKASMLFQKKNNNKVLIESTSNQVDQFGGYTGMTPKDFIEYVYEIASETGYPKENILLGGDHLGPNVWQNENEESAMVKAEEQIRSYISAGYRKIHLDTSFSLADDDKSKVLSPKTITERAARLCSVAEKTYSELNYDSPKPFYVIGTEVPIPGGAQEVEESISITSPEELVETIELSKKAFFEIGLEKAWERVIAVVVQPGVEFSDSKVFNYNKVKFLDVKNTIEQYSNLMLEAHSTDYQTENALREMVQDHFGILKVGPWLTFAVREAIFALANIENELVDPQNSSNLKVEIEKIMIENPKYWEKHYHGNIKELKLSRSYSYSDRIRYYWANENVDLLLNKMLTNLNNANIPNTLISQHFPIQYNQIMNEEISNNAESIIISKVTEVLKIYNNACGGNIEE